MLTFIVYIFPAKPKTLSSSPELERAKTQNPHSKSRVYRTVKFFSLFPSSFLSWEKATSTRQHNLFV